jgi:hypothetical protein
VSDKRQQLPMIDEWDIVNGASLIPAQPGGYVFDNLPHLIVHLAADETAAEHTTFTLTSTDGSGIEATNVIERGSEKLVTWPMLGPTRVVLNFDSVVGIRLGATVMRETLARVVTPAVTP